MGEEMKGQGKKKTLKKRQSGTVHERIAAFDPGTSFVQ